MSFLCDREKELLIKVHQDYGPHVTISDFLYVTTVIYSETRDVTTVIYSETRDVTTAITVRNQRCDYSHHCSKPETSLQSSISETRDVATVITVRNQRLDYNHLCSKPET